MDAINFYKNPYDNMPPIPERIVIGPYILEEIPVKDGKLVFPKEMDKFIPQKDNEPIIKPMKIKRNKNNLLIKKIDNITREIIRSKVASVIKAVFLLG